MFTLLMHLYVYIINTYIKFKLSDKQDRDNKNRNDRYVLKTREIMPLN